MEDLPIDIQKILGKKMEECSYGIAILANGSVINVRKKFKSLLKMWTVYSYLTEMEKNEEKEDFMKKTRGVFYNGELALRLSDVTSLVNGEETENNNKKGIGLRNYADIINSALNVYTENETEEPEDEND